MPNPVSTEPGHARYAALAQRLRDRVLQGDWPPGAALPAEQALAADHGVALGTARQALALLVAEGLIERIQGRGTFVRAGLSGATMLRFFRFSDGRSSSAPGSRILQRQTVGAPPETAARLGLAASAPLLRLRRLRSLGGLPSLLETIWLPLPDFSALASGPTDTWGDLLYPLYAQRCGLHVHRAVDQISFGPLKAPQALALGLPAGHPAAVVTRDAFDLTGRCIEHRVTRGDALAFHYTVTLT